MREIDVQAERLFENSKVLDRSIRRHQSKYYWATSPKIDAFDESVIAASVGKVVLEIGCSDGARAKIIASVANATFGIDISDVAIQVANSRNIPNASFAVCDAHSLPFDTGTFDIVVTNSLLHHLNLNAALSEISRVLKRGGVLCAREPLGLNPVISAYRWLTPRVRTVDERPFNRADLRLLRHHFSEEAIDYFGFLSLTAAFARLRVIRTFLTHVDDLIALTPFRVLFWQFAGKFKKRDQDCIGS